MQRLILKAIITSILEKEVIASEMAKNMAVYQTFVKSVVKIMFQ
jgi:hypothetical protein